MATIFDGKAFARGKLEELQEKVAELQLKKDIVPTLTSIFLTADSGSLLYTKIKRKTAESIGINFRGYEISSTSEVDKIASLILELNQDDSVQGILLQKPAGKNDFPDKVWSKLVSLIDPRKDIDCLTPQNLGLLLLKTPRFIPATAKAVIYILDEIETIYKGKKAVILGSSEILGKPLSLLLSDKGASVTLLNSNSLDAKNYLLDADIVVSATGISGLITADMVKEKAVVIDVGSPKPDVDFDSVKEKAGLITPVPGGVGPVTVVCLLENLVESVI